MARGRISHRDTLAANQKAMDGWANVFGKPKVSLGTPPPPVKKRTPKVATPMDVPLEKDIQKAILQYLKLRSDVVFVSRFNSGVAANTDGHGDTRYTRFNTMPGFPDIHGMLKGGHAFYIEVKRQGGKATPDQQSFIDMVRAGGGKAGVARSIEEAVAILA